MMQEEHNWKHTPTMYVQFRKARETLYLEGKESPRIMIFQKGVPVRWRRILYVEDRLTELVKSLREYTQDKGVHTLGVSFSFNHPIQGRARHCLFIGEFTKDKSIVQHWLYANKQLFTLGEIPEMQKLNPWKNTPVVVKKKKVSI